jgi:hypothetical protein
MMMTNRASMLTIFCSLAFPVIVTGQAPPELRKAMQARLQAVWTKDTLTWDRLTADEFTVVVPEGRLESKAERLATLKAEKPQAVHALEHEQIRAYGETVLHRFVDVDEWVLEVWVKQNGRWRVVAAQVGVAKP